MSSPEQSNLPEITFRSVNLEEDKELLVQINCEIEYLAAKLSNPELDFAEYQINWNEVEVTAGVTQADAAVIRIKNYINDPEGMAYIAEWGGDFLGFCAISIFHGQGKRIGYVDEIYINPDYRGRGLTKVIIYKLLQLVGNREIDVIRFTVSPANAPALKLVTELGSYPIKITFELPLKSLYMHL